MPLPSKPKRLPVQPCQVQRSSRRRTHLDLDFFAFLSSAVHSDFDFLVHMSAIRCRWCGLPLQYTVCCEPLQFLLRSAAISRQSSAVHLDLDFFAFLSSAVQSYLDFLVHDGGPLPLVRVAATIHCLL